MLENIGYFKITNREMEVMQILWQATTPMTASDIVDAVNSTYKMKKETSVFTVQNLLKSLLQKDVIQVASYTRVSKTTAREYTAKISADDYAVMQFNHYFSGRGAFYTPNIVANLLEQDKNEPDTIEALESLLAERKSQLVEKEQTKKEID